MTRFTRRALSAITATALLAGLFFGAPVSVRATPQTFYVADPGWLYEPGSSCESPDYWKDGDWTGGGAYNSDNDAIQDAADNAASGSVIFICAGTYNFAEVVTVSAGKNITFRGAGTDVTTLDGNDITRIFDSNPVHESDQGGVLSLRDLLIMDAQVTEWNGGAIVSDGLALNNVTITRTTGAYNGGAMYAEGDVSIVDSTFTGNIANADGGVLYAWNGDSTVTISNSVFDDNRAGAVAGGGGGAILGTTVTVANSVFTGNSSSYGGAIYATETATVTNSTFTDNFAFAGGAIDANITATVTNSNFTNNSAYMGGAIYGNSTTLTRSTFTSNFAVLGGAIGSAIVSAAANTFTENEASVGGGAIYAWVSATLTSSAFTSNAASFGGAVYADTATITRSSFTANSASESGGAIWSTTRATVTNSTFTSNSAIYRGGAINSETAEISGSHFIRNSSDQHGGAVYFWGATADDLQRLRRNTFTRNTAPAGGAITLGSCGPTFSRNQAARVEGSNRFSGNRATEQRRTNNVERSETACG